MFVDILPSSPEAKFYRRARPEPGHDMQRNSGSVELEFTEKSGTVQASRVFQKGAMKVRFPHVSAGQPPEAVLLNTTGGMTGGDSQQIAMDVEKSAAATVTTQSCERIYRSLGDDAVVTARFKVGPGARLDWLPQPVIFFDGARLRRETHVDVSANGNLLAVEAVIFGRTESGEAVEYGALSDAWFVRRAGRLIHADRFAVGGAVRTILAKPCALSDNRAMATIRYVAPDAQERLDAMRALLCDCTIPAAASAWNGMMLARFAASDGYSLNRELVRILTAFRGTPMPKAWSL